MKILFPAIIIFLFSCTYKEADQFIPPPPVDSVSYSVDILPLVQTYCFGPGYSNKGEATCHYPPGSIGNISVFFDDCANLRHEAVDGQLYLHLLSPTADMPYLSQHLAAEDTAL